MRKIAIEKKVVVLPLIVYQKHWNSPNITVLSDNMCLEEKPTQLANNCSTPSIDDLTKNSGSGDLTHEVDISG